MSFTNRVEAGRQLAGMLGHVRAYDPVVIGLPRGGVPVAFEVGKALGAPLDVIVVGKLGVPFQPELAMGAIGEDGAQFLNADVLRSARIEPDELSVVEQEARAAVEHRIRALRRARPGIALAGRTAVIVDDGIATGATVRTACQIARRRGAARVVLATPVAAADTVAALGKVADEVITVATPARVQAVGEQYDDFPQITDREVVTLLWAAAGRPVTAAPADQSPRAVGRDVAVQAAGLRLPARLTMPSRAVGLVVFALPGGSSRHSPRNRYLAGRFHQAGLGTLLVDLLTPEEEVDWRKVFDIELLAARLGQATGWIRHACDLGELPVGLFGPGTGAAAALWAAAEPDAGMAAIVSHNGRPDLAIRRLDLVPIPTMFIVGARHDHVLNLNRLAQAHLRCPNRVTVVPDATRRFDEPGSLPLVATLARDWFAQHLGAPLRPQPVAP
ncbi:MAG TPA: phosphoribosyltransferase family protein [Micromonosporaceae bacterium]